MRRLRTKAIEFPVAFDQPGQHFNERSPIEHDNRQDRAGLDCDVEQLPLLRVKAQKFVRQDQMPRGRNGKEFCNTLYNAEDDGRDRIAHAAPALAPKRP